MLQNILLSRRYVFVHYICKYDSDKSGDLAKSQIRTLLFLLFLNVFINTEFKACTCNFFLLEINKIRCFVQVHKKMSVSLSYTESHL